jgi:quercetin dioxygenase-like cupin family protein
MQDRPELSPESLLGVLPDDERNEIEALLATGSLTPVAPPAGVRARLLRTLGSVDRFATFMDDLTRIFQLPAEAIRGLLARLDGDQWETSLLGVPLQGAKLFHFKVGAQLAATGGAGGMVRIAPNVTFPRHRHHGGEVNYVLEGSYLGGGRVHGPGSAIEMDTGSDHDYVSGPDRDLVLMVLHRGITILPG